MTQNIFSWGYAKTPLLSKSPSLQLPVARVIFSL